VLQLHHQEVRRNVRYALPPTYSHHHFAAVLIQRLIRVIPTKLKPSTAFFRSVSIHGIPVGYANAIPFGCKRRI
jgi:hypothetical protein